MDRRKMHKANNHLVGKNKGISTQVRATKRAANLDSRRDISPDVTVAAPLPKVSRVERLKKWRAEKEEKKKQEAESKKKPFVTVVKRGVFLDKTNYTEMNKLRRKNNATKKVKPTAAIQIASVNEENLIPISGTETISEYDLLEETNEVDDNTAVTAEDNIDSQLNTTFELPNSTESNLDNDDQLLNGNTEESSSETSQTNEAVSQSFKTPSKSPLNTSLNYVSPFVTISRGKISAQKEKKVRESFYKLETSHPHEMSQIARQNLEAAGYFRFQVQGETDKLMQMIDYWDKYKIANGHVDSVYLDQIDVAIGQTRLLISKKFKQFLGLISQCENASGQPAVLPKDLEGFWSMVFMQVENCTERFRKLATLKENDWVEVDLLPAKVLKQTKRKVVKKEVLASSGIQKMIEEARMKMKETKISATSTSSRNVDGSTNFSMALRQTPARLSMTHATAKTPKSIIKVKTPGGALRHTKSVAFQSPSSMKSSNSPKVAATPKPRSIKRRASTSAVPNEKQHNLTKEKSAFLTPITQKVSKDMSASPLRRSHRRLFSVVEQSI